MLNRNCLLLTPIGAIALLLQLVVGGIGMPSLHAEIHIALKKNATVADPTVRLGDIARIEGASFENTAKMAALKIQRSPMPGKTVTIRQDRIQSRLSRFGLDQSQYRLTEAHAVVVRRESTTISKAAIQHALVAFIRENVPWRKDQLKIKKMRLRHEPQVASGSVRIQVLAPKHTDWIGTIPFVVQLWRGQRMVKKLTVPTTIEVWADVLLAAKPLVRGELTDAGDFKAVRMNLARAPSNVILASVPMEGKRVTRTIAPNSILRSDQFDKAPVVKRGDVVKVVAHSPLMTISVKGIVKQDGGIGDRVRVQNVRSKKIILAMVMDPQTVQVEF